MKIFSADSFKGEIELPGDKSISHRGAIFASLSIGQTTIENFSTSLDCGSTLGCLNALGVQCWQDGTRLVVDGVGKDGYTKSAGVLNCGNSGTTMRLLAGVLAGQDFDSVLTGDESLAKRPMKRIIEPLQAMGVHVESENGKPPLHIFGRKPLKSISYNLPIASAQIKSAVLLAGMYGEGNTIVNSPPSKFAVSSSRNHTELMLSYLGAKIDEDFNKQMDGFVHQITLGAESGLTARDLYIPSDISAAAFFIVSASVIENSYITLRGVGINPTRTAFIDVMRKYGADIEFKNHREENREEIADIVVQPGRMLQNRPTMKLDGDIIANLIDEVPILAILGTQLRNGLEIRDAKELRVKETDRISAVVKNLKRMNAGVIEYDDGFRVEKSELRGARVNSFGDHRIAMAFAVAGLLATGETEIISSECADVSFPGFFDALASAIK